MQFGNVLTGLGNGWMQLRRVFLRWMTRLNAMRERLDGPWECLDGSWERMNAPSTSLFLR